MRNPKKRAVECASHSPKTADLTDLTDTALCDVVRAETQDPRGTAAYGVLYARHRDTVMAQAYRMTGHRDRAEDLVEDTFARVLQVLLGGGGPRTSVVGYLLVTLRSEVARSGALERGSVALPPETIVQLSEEAEPDFAESYSERDQICRAFAQLPEDARRLLWLIEVEQVSLGDAAERLGVKIGALRVQVHRARKRLATAYLQQYVERGEPECLPASRQLALRARGELGKRQQQRVDEHLRGCVSCTRQLARLESLQRQLRSWMGPVIVTSGGGAARGVADTPTAGMAGATAAAHEGPVPAPLLPVTLSRFAGAAGILLMLGGLAWEMSRPVATPVGPPIARPTPTAPGATSASGGGSLVLPRSRWGHTGEGESSQTVSADRSEPWPLAMRERQPPRDQQVRDEDDATPHWRLRE